ncbi:ribonuclease H1 [Tolypothrix sp. PCC 7601]|nr:ribonuclease H1 [Tolypothrix sp. PCC 7601]
MVSTEAKSYIGRALYKYLAPSSPNPFSRRRRGTKSLAPLTLWVRGWG